MRVWIDSIENDEINPDEIVCELYADIDEDDMNWWDSVEDFFNVTTLYTEDGDVVDDEEIRLWTEYKSVSDYLRNSLGGERLKEEIETFLRGEAEREEAARYYWEEFNSELEQESY